MSEGKSSYTITILKRLLEGEAMSSSDAIASNSNQYFKIIKDHGIALVEVMTPNITNSGKHKERSLYQEAENVDRARNYLKKLQGK